MTLYKKLRLIIVVCSAATASTILQASDNEPAIRATAALELNAANGDFAPYYIASNRHGTLTQARGTTLNLGLNKKMDMSRRFSYEFGVQGYFGITNQTDYLRFNPQGNDWYSHAEHPANVWLQQLYASIKYRGVYLSAGMKNHHSRLLDERLSSGDMVHGANARPMPGVIAGFVDFQDIPLTNGWVQIDGELGYWKYIDNDWQKSHYSYFNYHQNLGGWHNYKRCFFRTKPSMPFSLTIGMQAAAQFAGETTWFQKGKVSSVKNFGLKASDFLDMLILRQGDDYWKGNHVGSWDINGRYRLRSGHEIKLYVQWLWEDGSGIGKLNGLDGLWGAEWKAPAPGPISGAVIEVLTFMNQSGPMHYDPADIPGTTMTGTKATGADNYYNNTWYNGYAHFGMSLGSPMFPSPIYNTDGYTTAFVDNRFWGIHAGINGTVISGLDYRLLASYRRFFGTMMQPRTSPVHDFSAMLEAEWKINRVPGLKLTAQVAFDAGTSIYGDKGGALIGLSYSGLFNLKSKKFTPCAL